MNQRRPEQQLRAALEHQDPSGATALAVLGHALEWSAQYLDDISTGRDGDTAFDDVAALDDALQSAPRLLDAAHDLLAAGAAGGTVERDVRQALERLAAIDQQLVQQRQRHTDLIAAEDAIRTRAAEADAEDKRIDDLRALQRRSSQLDQLRQARQELERNADELLQSAQDEDARFTVAATDVAKAIGGLTDDLSTAARTAKSELADVQRRLTEQQRKLTEASAQTRACDDEMSAITAQITELETRRARTEEKLRELAARARLHADADKDVAAALHAAVADTGDDGVTGHVDGAPAANGVDDVAARHHALDMADAVVHHIDAHLDRLDALLRTALRAHEEHEGAVHAKIPLGAAAAAAPNPDPDAASRDDDGPSGPPQSADHTG